MDMCRFYGVDDPGYKQVGGELKSLMQQVEESIRKREKKPQRAQQRKGQFF